VLELAGTIATTRLVVGQTAWRFGVSVREYREIEAGERWPSWET
jgi:hypothetical protein